jgi:hypothetical protein
MPAADESPTILQVLPALETGGVERGTIEMTQAIVAAGGRALVASAGGRLVPQLERAGGRHVVLPLMTKDPLNILFNSVSIGKLIRRHQVRLVHARSRAPAWSAWMAARAANVPFITTWHGVYSEGFPGKRFYNAVMARGERVIAISRYVASVLEAGYRVEPRRIPAAWTRRCSTRKTPAATGCTALPRPGACRRGRRSSCCQPASPVGKAPNCCSMPWPGFPAAVLAICLLSSSAATRGGSSTGASLNSVRSAWAWPAGSALPGIAMTCPPP